MVQATRTPLTSSRNAMIEHLADDTYFQSILSDNSIVKIYKRPLTAVTIKKYPAVSVYHDLTANAVQQNNTINTEGYLYIQCAVQNKDLDDGLDSLDNLMQSVLKTVRPCLNLDKNVNRVAWNRSSFVGVLENTQTLYTLLGQLDFTLYYSYMFM